MNKIRGINNGTSGYGMVGGLSSFAFGESKSKSKSKTRTKRCSAIKKDNRRCKRFSRNKYCVYHK